MTILVNGTVTGPQTTRTLVCTDQFGRTAHVVLTVAQPVNQTAGNCYLVRNNRNGTATALHLPNIQSIEETDTAMLTEISTIIYGFDDNFVMDLGTTQRFTVTLKRNQPLSVSDDNNYLHSEQWSNGHWFDMLCSFIDGWQNLNCGYVQHSGQNNVFAQTGGFHFHYEPSVETAYQGVSYANLYPVIDENVFIAGNISMSYSGANLQTLNVSIPLAVSTMVRNQSGQPMREVVFDPNISGLEPFKQLYPVNVDSVAPGLVPSEWLNAMAGATLSGWGAAASGGTIYRPGDLIPKNISKVYARYTYPYYALADDGSSSGGVTYQITNSDLSYLTYILVGHGGLGGRGIMQIGGLQVYGGGGGSGGYRTGNISLNHARYGRVTSIKLKAATALTEDSTLTLTYYNNNNPVEVTLSIDNGVSGTGGKITTHNNKIPGEGGSGGAGGVSGTDATETAGGQGGDLSEYINDLRIYYNGSTSGYVPPTAPGYTSSHVGPTCGAGHDGTGNKSDPRQGADGLVIVCLFE